MKLGVSGEQNVHLFRLSPVSLVRVGKPRQHVGRLVHSLWTDDTGLGAPLFDGRVDELDLL